MTYYRLDQDHNVIPCDLKRWAEERENNSVARMKIGGILVSTVFLGIDHGFAAEGPPIVFETMIFGGEHDEFQSRCSTWTEALEMHLAACAKAFPKEEKSK